MEEGWRYWLNFIFTSCNVWCVRTGGVLHSKEEQLMFDTEV